MTEIRENLSNEEIEECFNPEKYIGVSCEMANDVLNFSEKKDVNF